MNLTVVTPAQTVALTTLAQVKAEMRLTMVDAARDAWIEDKIEEASAAIAEELDRPLTRQRVRQRFDGSGRSVVALDLTPIVSLEAVTDERRGGVELLTSGETEIRIYDRDAGLIWNDRGWPETGPLTIWLTVDQLAQPGDAPWEATYLGGWLTRADDIMASGITASGSELLQEAGSGPMPLVAPGDQLVLRGWENNRGRYLVTGRTDLSITVDGTFTTEVGGANALVAVRNAPAGLERACIDAIRTWFDRQTQNVAVSSEHIGDWGATYIVPDGMAGGTNVLPGPVLMALDRWRRPM